MNKTLLANMKIYTCKCDADFSLNIEMYALCKTMKYKNLFRVDEYIQVF